MNRDPWPVSYLTQTPQPSGNTAPSSFELPSRTPSHSSRPIGQMTSPRYNSACAPWGSTIRSAVAKVGNHFVNDVRWPLVVATSFDGQTSRSIAWLNPDSNSICFRDGGRTTASIGWSKCSLSSLRLINDDDQRTFSIG